VLGCFVGLLTEHEDVAAGVEHLKLLHAVETGDEIGRVVALGSHRRVNLDDVLGSLGETDDPNGRSCPGSLELGATEAAITTLVDARRISTASRVDRVLMELPRFFPVNSR
jgi:hypothetical protein